MAMKYGVGNTEASSLGQGHAIAQWCIAIAILFFIFTGLFVADEQMLVIAGGIGVLCYVLIPCLYARRDVAAGRKVATIMASPPSLFAVMASMDLIVYQNPYPFLSAMALTLLVLSLGFAGVWLAGKLAS